MTSQSNLPAKFESAAYQGGSILGLNSLFQKQFRGAFHTQRPIITTGGVDPIRI